MVLNLPSAVLAAGAIIWAVGLTIGLFFLFRRVSRLTAGTKKESLDQVLNQLLTDFQKEHQSHTEINRQLIKIESQLPRHLQKIGLVRFNPFVSTGGNQSFTLAILDGTDSGLIVTSLHSRDGTRLYTKSIKSGKGESELSKEEQAALTQAKEKHV